MIMREGRALREAGGGMRGAKGGEVIKESCFTENELKAGRGAKASVSL